MNHIQLNIDATGEEQELLIGRFSMLGAAGFEQTDTQLIAYFEEDTFPSYDAYEVLKKFVYRITTMEEQNWNAVWESNFAPVRFGDFCGVRAQFHPPFTDVAHEIIITPKMSFGTGHHATTGLMIENMQAINFANKTVLDFGTGTGILAILAEKLGAARITAIDNDAWSFENVRENIALNNCLKIEPLLSGTIPARSFDVILANITKNVLLEYMDVLKSCLAQNGHLLMSGLLDADKDELIAAAQNRGMKLAADNKRDGWASLLFIN